MVIMVLILVFFVLSVMQLVQDNGLSTLKDVSFWLIVVSFVAIASFVVGSIQV